VVDWERWKEKDREWEYVRREEERWSCVAPLLARRRWEEEWRELAGNQSCQCVWEEEDISDVDWNVVRTTNARSWWRRDSVELAREGRRERHRDRTRERESVSCAKETSRSWGEAAEDAKTTRDVAKEEEDSWRSWENVAGSWENNIAKQEDRDDARNTGRCWKRVRTTNAKESWESESNLPATTTEEKPNSLCVWEEDVCWESDWSVVRTASANAWWRRDWGELARDQRREREEEERTAKHWESVVNEQQLNSRESRERAKVDHAKREWEDNARNCEDVVEEGDAEREDREEEDCARNAKPCWKRAKLVHVRESWERESRRLVAQEDTSCANWDVVVCRDDWRSARTRNAEALWEREWRELARERARSRRRRTRARRRRRRRSRSTSSRGARRVRTQMKARLAHLKKLLRKVSSGVDDEDDFSDGERRRRKHRVTQLKRKLKSLQKRLSAQHKSSWKARLAKLTEQMGMSDKNMNLTTTTKKTKKKKSVTKKAVVPVSRNTMRAGATSFVPSFVAVVATLTFSMFMI
jgi:hypothetical protein